MRGESVDFLNIRAHLVPIAVDAHLLLTVFEAAAERTFSHIPNNQNGVRGIFEPMHKMVLNTAKLAHAIGGNDNHRAFGEIERLRLVDRAGELKL